MFCLWAFEFCLRPSALHLEMINAPNNNIHAHDKCLSTAVRICFKSLLFCWVWLRSTFNGWFSGSTWLLAVVCKHNLKGTWLGHPNTHTSSNQKTCRGLAVLGWKRPLLAVPPPPPTSISTYWPLRFRQTCRHLCQSGGSFRCAITPAPLRPFKQLQKSPLPPSSYPAPLHLRVKAPGCQTLITCGNNICAPSIMGCLKVASVPNAQSQSHREAPR